MRVRQTVERCGHMKVLGECPHHDTAHSSRHEDTFSHCWVFLLKAAQPNRLLVHNTHLPSCLVFESVNFMQEEASTFGLQIKWSKTKILQVPSSTCPLAKHSRWQMDMLKWSMHLSIWDARLTPLVAVEGRSWVGLAQLGLAWICYRGGCGSQASGWKPTPLSDIHCASFDVRVWDLGHHKLPALSSWCIWHVGTTQDLEDIIYSPHVKCGSQRNHWLFTAFSPGD